MYSHCAPAPITISLAGKEGYELRLRASEYAKTVRARGGEAGTEEEQSYGLLAEIAIRRTLGLPDIGAGERELGHDIILPTGVRVDVKCRSGTQPFQETYIGTQDIPREAKHNFFIRQFYDERLQTDIYLMAHLQTPGRKTPLPGTPRQRKWNLFVCGWVSKERAKRESIYLPRGALTEKGNNGLTIGRKKRNFTIST